MRIHERRAGLLKPSCILRCSLIKLPVMSSPGEQHGYNVPEVKLCREFPEWLWDGGHERILSCKDDRDLPEPVKRAICDGYICLYEYKDSTAL